MGGQHRGRKRPGLTEATEQTVKVCGSIGLHVYLGNPLFRVLFEIVENLAIKVLLVTSYIDRFVRGIFTKERSIFPFHSTKIAVVYESAARVSEETEVLKSRAKLDTIRNVVGVGRVTVLPKRTQQRVLVLTHDSELLMIQPQPGTS